MNENLMPGIRKHIVPLGGFENAKLLKIDEGYCLFEIDITESMLNLYGNTHGGVLFTLCDMAAGMSTYAYGVKNVTSSASISFLKRIAGGKIRVEGKTLHRGQSTSVCEVKAFDEDNELLLVVIMNMFILGDVQTDV